MFAWTNYECVFNTENTRNDFGNSTYYVWREGVFRIAPINQIMAPSMTSNIKQYITYLAPGNPLYEAFKRRIRNIKRGQRNDTVRLIYASFDHVMLAVHIEGESTVDGVAYREPQNDWYPCDFQWSCASGVRQSHVGHKIMNLSPGRPAIDKPDEFDARLPRGETAYCPE